MFDWQTWNKQKQKQKQQNYSWNASNRKSEGYKQILKTNHNGHILCALRCTIHISSDRGCLMENICICCKAHQCQSGMLLVRDVTRFLIFILFDITTPANINCINMGHCLSTVVHSISSAFLLCKYFHCIHLQMHHTVLVRLRAFLHFFVCSIFTGRLCLLLLLHWPYWITHLIRVHLALCGTRLFLISAMWRRDTTEPIYLRPVIESMFDGVCKHPMPLCLCLVLTHSVCTMLKNFFCHSILLARHVRANVHAGAWRKRIHF